MRLPKAIFRTILRTLLLGVKYQSSGRSALILRYYSVFFFFNLKYLTPFDIAPSLPHSDRPKFLHEILYENNHFLLRLLTKISFVPLSALATGVSLPFRIWRNYDEIGKDIYGPGDESHDL